MRSQIWETTRLQSQFLSFLILTLDWNPLVTTSFSPEWDKWPLTIIRVTEYRTEPTWPWEDWLHYKLCYSALLYIRCPGDAIKPSLTFLTCSINTISDFYWIIPPPPFCPPHLIFTLSQAEACISICCQNLWFSDKNCILKQFEEKLLKLHFTVCQMMFYKRMNLWVLREFFSMPTIIRILLRYVM